MANIKHTLEMTFAEFGVPSQVINVIEGLQVNKYQLHIDNITDIKKVKSGNDLERGIAYRLGLKDNEIRLTTDGAIIVEVKKEPRGKLLYSEIAESEEFKSTTAQIPLIIGRDTDNKNIIYDLARAPHILTAGTTGSGKSVWINNVICGIAQSKLPQEVQILMIDPKMVELAAYNKLPHRYVGKVITEIEKAEWLLKYLVDEMVKRYAEMQAVGARNINEYNKKTDKPFVRIVVIIDEFADMMMSGNKEIAKSIEHSISRLGQMARAAGIHMIIATQRPSAKVITGLIKANIPSRIAFTVSTNMESRIILDSGGAEKLLNFGDMLFSPIGTSTPIRVQGAYISDSEIDKIVANTIQKYPCNRFPHIL